jgi:hypothetical protein
MSREKDDPELSYRRGYQQGAYRAFVAIEGFLPAEAQAIMKQWTGVDLHQWRLAGMRGESGRGTKGLTTGAEPPEWRLGYLRRPNSN